MSTGVSHEKKLLALTIASLLSSPIYAQNKSDEVNSIAQAVEEGIAHLAIRYRYENVDQTGFNDNAELSSARLRLNYKTQEISNFSTSLRW